MNSSKDVLVSFLKEQSSTLEELSKQTETIERIVDILIKARDTDKKIYVMGNGGSASNASHFVADLLKTAITKNDKRFSASSLSDNIPVILAWSNDASYDDIFVEQLKNFLSEGDVIIGFSGSGQSKNIIKAFEYGLSNNAICIGFTGMSGGTMSKICDPCIVVPSDDMLGIECIHVTLFHCIISSIRNIGVPMFTYD